MHTIGFYDKVDDKKQAAFVIFYALDGKPWFTYKSKPERQNLTIPTCLMLNRADGAIGFIGGMVEPGETLEDAAIREVKEEIGHDLQLKLEPLVAHDIGPITTHAFVVELSYDQVRKIQVDATEAEHFGSEVTGIFLPHLIDYSKINSRGGLNNLLQTVMAPSVKEELVYFLLKKELTPKDELDKLCTTANLSLDQLLK